MQTLFSEEGLRAVTERINRLTPDSQRQWGKMDAAQMLAHTRIPLEVALGRHTLPKMWIMKLLGGSIRKGLLSDKPVKKNSPTAPGMKMDGVHDFEKEKMALIQTIKDFVAAGKAGKLPERHPYFGKFNTEEWGRMQMKHIDHHLQQFGV